MGLNQVLIEITRLNAGEMYPGEFDQVVQRKLKPLNKYFTTLEDVEIAEGRYKDLDVTCFYEWVGGRGDGLETYASVYKVEYKGIDITEQAGEGFIERVENILDERK